MANFRNKRPRASRQAPGGWRVEEILVKERVAAQDRQVSVHYGRRRNHKGRYVVGRYGRVQSLESAKKERRSYDAFVSRPSYRPRTVYGLDDGGMDYDTAKDLAGALRWEERLVPKERCPYCLRYRPGYVDWEGHLAYHQQQGHERIREVA